MAEYATAAGFVQFDIDERDVGDQTVRDVTIRTLGAEGKLVKITVWPEFDEAVIERGDFVAADGEFQTRQVGDKTYLNLNAKKLAVTPQVQRAGRETEVVNKKTKSKF